MVVDVSCAIYLLLNALRRPVFDLVSQKIHHAGGYNLNFLAGYMLHAGLAMMSLSPSTLGRGLVDWYSSYSI
jgi:hypothetical protein